MTLCDKIKCDDQTRIEDNHLLEGVGDFTANIINLYRNELVDKYVNKKELKENPLHGQQFKEPRGTGNE